MQERIPNPKLYGNDVKCSDTVLRVALSRFSDLSYSCPNGNVKHIRDITEYDRGGLGIIA